MEEQTSWFRHAAHRSGVASCTVQSVAGSPSSAAHGATGYRPSSSYNSQLKPAQLSGGITLPS